MTKIEFTIPLKPQAWQRVSRNAQGASFVPKKTRDFEQSVGYFALAAAKGFRFQGPLRLTARFILERPKTSKIPHPSVRPDLDNYMKALKDGLNGVLYLDDAQVVQYGPGTGKYYCLDGSPTRIEIKLEIVTD